MSAGNIATVCLLTHILVQVEGVIDTHEEHYKATLTLISILTVSSPI